MKLAVILPAYNAENFLTECLDSLLNQTFSDFCILAVNDASTDNTGNILEDMRRKILAYVFITFLKTKVNLP